MVFSSLLFMFVYLPVVLGIYYLTPLRFRNLFLLFANLAFYGFGEPVYIIIMLISICVDYTHGILVQRNRDNDKKAKYFVFQSIVLNLGLLFFFKYYDFVLITLKGIFPFLSGLEPIGLPLPIGISFYTFQTMSYTIDIYRRDGEAQKNIVDFGVYVTLFPQLIAGPIVKYKDVASQLTNRRSTIDTFTSGIQLFTYGLFKKVMLANNIGMLWDTYKQLPVSQLSVVGAWLGIIAFAFQIFFDFSGYSDMARGLGRMFGFEFLENFNFPYISQSATEFWRRWHISLGSWFREYLYIPLGGNRKGSLLTYRNILIVWLATGLWHGAEWNFILWGLYYAVILLIEKSFLHNVLQRFPRFVSHIYALIVILVGWTIFAIEGNLPLMGNYLATMFGLGGSGFVTPEVFYYLSNYGITLLLCAVFSTPFWSTLKVKIPAKIETYLMAILIPLTLIICTGYLVNATYNPFLYFRF